MGHFFQMSDVGRLVVVVYLAYIEVYMIMDKRQQIKHFRLWDSMCE